MSPIMLKTVIFLNVNREFWDVNDAAVAIKDQAPSEVQSQYGDLFFGC